MLYDAELVESLRCEVCTRKALIMVSGEGAELSEGVEVRLFCDLHYQEWKKRLLPDVEQLRESF